MSLTSHFVATGGAAKGSGAQEERVRRVLAPLRFLGLQGTSLWSEDGKRARPFFLKEKGILNPLLPEDIRADVRSVAARLRAHPGLQANLLSSAELFEPTRDVTADLFVGGLHLLPDEDLGEQDLVELPKPAIEVLLRLHALPLMCRLLDFQEGCPKISAQLRGLADLLLPDLEVQEGLIGDLASRLWPDGAGKMGEQEKEALLLEGVLWRLSALKVAISEHKMMGHDFELPPFTAPKQPTAAPTGFLDASWTSLPSLIEDQAARRKRRSDTTEGNTDSRPHPKRRSELDPRPRPSSPPRRSEDEDDDEEEDEEDASSSASSRGHKSPPRAALRKSSEYVPPALPQTTPEEVRQRSRGAGAGFGDPYGHQDFHAELETDLTKEPGVNELGGAFQKTRASCLMILAYTAMHDGKFYGPPLSGKQWGTFDLPKLWRNPKLRLVRHSFYIVDTNKNFRQSCQSLGPFFEDLRTLIENLNELSRRIQHMAREQNKSGKPKYGWLAGRAVEECARITSFISVLNRLQGQYHNETHLMAYAASALYLHFATGWSNWLEQPNHTLWERLTPHVGLHCDTCGELGHLSGGHAKVSAYCTAQGIKVRDAAQFPPDKVANLPVPKKARSDARQSSPPRSSRPSQEQQQQQDHNSRGWRDREHGDGGRSGNGNNWRGDHRDGHQSGNRYAPSGQQRQRGRGWQGGDRNGQRSR